jgi:uncharacterized protein (TIGR03083 family)
MTGTTVTQLIDAIEEVLTETLALVRTLDPADGARPTECPGWTVQDNLAHMVGLEQVLGGAPEPEVEVPEFAHVKNDAGAYMERHVHARRGLTLVAVADELEALIPHRIDQLRSLAAEGDPEVPGPFGLRRLSRSLPVRVFDLWAHEQDIRRALAKPPRMGGLSSAVSLDRALVGWTMGLPQADLGLDGELLIEVTAPEPSSVVVTLGAGGPAATLRGDLGQLTRAFCGRGDPDPTLLSGDPGMVAALSDNLAMTP